MVELVPDFDIMSAQPAAFEERHILVNLIVLVGVEARQRLCRRRRIRAVRECQGNR